MNKNKDSCCHKLPPDNIPCGERRDPCGRCDPPCELTEPCVGYGCPVTLYDRCVFYTGQEMVSDGVPEGADLSVVIDSLRRTLASAFRQMDLYHQEVRELKRMVNEISNSITGGSGTGEDETEEEVW